MTIAYRPGKDNPADFASRHPSAVISTSRSEKVAEEYVNLITSQGLPALKIEDIKQETSQDAEMQSLISAIQTNNWADLPNTYQNIKDELAVTGDGSLVLRGHRIVLPESLRLTAIHLSHEGHQGLVKSKQLLRTYVWFPGIDKMVEKVIGKCLPCQANVVSHKREPLQMTPLPAEPWQHLAADFFGPLPSGDYLMVIIDEHSKFPVVEIVRHLSATSIVPVLDKVFATFGIPHQLKTDNGAPFNGHQFKQFASYLGFKHHRVTPRWPEANGEAERFMKNLGKAIRTSECDGIPWKQGLNSFLRSYRSTPHSSTRQAPTTALFGRTMNIKLPTVRNSVSDSIHEADQLAKAKMKTYADARRHTSPINLAVGDAVLVLQDKKNKLSSPYSPHPYVILDICGSMVTAKRHGHKITRNSSFFKRVPETIPNYHQLEEDLDEEIAVPQGIVDIGAPPQPVPDVPRELPDPHGGPAVIPRELPDRDRRLPARLRSDYVLD